MSPGLCPDQILLRQTESYGIFQGLGFRYPCLVFMGIEKCDRVLGVGNTIGPSHFSRIPIFKSGHKAFGEAIGLPGYRIDDHLAGFIGIHGGISWFQLPYGLCGFL